VIEGTDDSEPTEQTVWREYEFRGKPGDPLRRAPQIAPYHLRLDWLMWFAAMDSPENHPWFTALLVKLLEGDPATLSLLRVNPFPNHPPRIIRAEYFLVPLHDAGRASAFRPMVDAGATRTLFPPGGSSVERKGLCIF